MYLHRAEVVEIYTRTPSLVICSRTLRSVPFTNCALLDVEACCCSMTGDDTRLDVEACCCFLTGTRLDVEACCTVPRLPAGNPVKPPGAGAETQRNRIKELLRSGALNESDYAIMRLHVKKLILYCDSKATTEERFVLMSNMFASTLFYGKIHMFDTECCILEDSESDSDTD